MKGKTTKKKTTKKKVVKKKARKSKTQSYDVGSAKGVLNFMDFSDELAEFLVDNLQKDTGLKIKKSKEKK